MNDKLIRVLLVLCLAGVFTSGCSRASKMAKFAHRADANFKAGDFDRAELEYKNLLRLDPTNQVALRNLGLMFFEQGRLVQSFALLANTRKALPEDDEVRVKYAMALLAGGSPRQAREETVQLLARQPTNQDVLLLLVDSSLTTNDLQDARQRLTRLKGASGEVSGYHVALGMLQLRNRDTNAAAGSFRLALTIDPKSSVAHMAMGGMYAMGRDTNNALAEFTTAAELAPARSPHPLRLADFLVAQGDAAGAKKRLEQIAKQTPDYLPALMRLAQLALAEQRFQDAEGVLKSVLTRDPVHLDGMLMLARLWLAQNQPDKAVLELERVLKVFPRLPQVHYQLAVAHLMQNDLPGAAKSLSEALVILPDYPEATLLLAELNIRRGDTAPAVRALTRLVAQRPGLPQAQFLLAGAQRAAGQLDLALRLYENLSRNFPTNPQPPFLMGLVQRQQGKNAEARKSFATALSYAPDFLSAAEQLINLDLAEKQFAGARERAQSEVARAPTNAAPYVLLARVHLAETNPAAAEATLLKALAVAPEFGPANTLLAQIYVFTKQQPAALKKLNEMVTRNTNDLASWLMIAELHSAASNYVASKDAYESMLAVNPKHGPALNNLAWLYSEQLGDPKRALELAGKARDLNPRDPSTADTFGWVLYKNGDYVRALALIQESARELSEQPDVLFHLGTTHYMMGEEAAARVALQSAIQLAAPEATWKAEAQERLQILDFDPATADAGAVKELESRAARMPRDPILQARRGAVFERAGAWDQAATAYEKALQLNTNLVPVVVKLAQLYSTHPRNPERAFVLARRARSLEPDDPKIAHTLGRLAYDSAQTAADFQWAHGLLQESARALSGNPEVLYDLALATYAVGDVTNALRAMQTVAGLKPAPARAAAITQFLEMNKFMARPEEAPAAAAKVAAVLQQQPDYVPALRVHGLLQELKRDYPGARDTYERVLKLFPLFTPAYKSLALLYANQLKDAPKAYDYATKAREAFPQDLPVARVLGELAYQRGEYPRAVQLLKESAPAFAQDAELFYTLGLAHYKLKQSREAKEALTKALGLAPSSPQAAEAKRILAELK